MLFLTRDHKAGAHRAGRFLAADPCAVAHLDGSVKALLIREVQRRLQGNDLVGLAVAQAFGHRRRIDDVAGIEDVVGIKAALDLLIQPVQFRAEEALVHPAARPAVTMLTAERAAVAM